MSAPELHAADELALLAAAERLEHMFAQLAWHHHTYTATQFEADLPVRPDGDPLSGDYSLVLVAPPHTGLVGAPSSHVIVRGLGHGTRTTIGQMAWVQVLQGFVALQLGAIHALRAERASA